eukprot:scaffold29791_cov70-Cyclotella_meneghiniana.AAC.8
MSCVYYRSELSTACYAYNLACDFMWWVLVGGSVCRHITRHTAWDTRQGITQDRGLAHVPQSYDDYVILSPVG